MKEIASKELFTPFWDRRRIRDKIIIIRDKGLVSDGKYKRLRKPI